MKKLVICLLILVSACVFVPGSGKVQAKSAIPNYAVDCYSGGACTANTWWGNNPKYPSYGDATYIPAVNCTIAGCFVQSNGAAHYDLAGCALQSHDFECLTGIEAGILAQTATTDPGHSPCSGFGSGIFWYIVVRNTNAQITSTTCALVDASNFGNNYLIKFSRYFAGSGGYNVWLLGTHNGTPVCNPCGFPFNVYGEPQTLYYTSNELFFYDNTYVTNPVGTVYWIFNQFQTTDGKWHYQGNSGNYNEYGTYAQLWWRIPPNQSPTGGDLNGCVDKNTPHPDCLNI